MLGGKIKFRYLMSGGKIKISHFHNQTSYVGWKTQNQAS